jgi:uncharacterized repeat protein (TIGR03803 family)
MLVRLFWAATFILSAFGVQAGVALTTLYSFTNQVNGVFTDNICPQAGLVFGTDGNLYGTTSGTFGPDVTGGPAYNDARGSVFEISTNGALTNIHVFGTVLGPANTSLDGAYPVAALVQGSDGYFYGTTALGGTLGDNPYGLGDGTVFKISTSGALTTLYSFTYPVDGSMPDAGLVQASDGYFYGTTSRGTNTEGGTVFKMSTNGALTTLYVFTNFTNGYYPQSGLVQGNDGYFYGTTEFSVFKISTNGALTTLHIFGGSIPFVGLVLGGDGYFYGTSSEGGTNTNALDQVGYGTIFKMSTNGEYSTLYSFAGGNDGESPLAALVQGSDGNFYGTTIYVGANVGYGAGGSLGGYGTVFQITTNGAYTSLYSFTGGSDGAYPVAPLVQGPDGTFYGTAQYGGTNGYGTVFRLTVVPTPQIAMLTNGALNITWRGEAGARYQLQCTSELSSSDWTSMGTPVIATGAAVSTTDVVTNGSQRFYRLMLSQ